MRRASALLALVPVLGLGELALHFFFASRAPDPTEYAALGAELLALKRPGEPVVVAPAWAEPWVRQASPASFPLNELGRADDAGFAGLLEVSLLGQSAPGVAAFPVEEERSVGAFRVRRRKNPQFQPLRYDFVSALEDGHARVFAELGDELSECIFSERPRTEAGGLHGHVAYPRRRFQCGLGRFVGVTLIDDQDYRPRRCILAQPPDGGSIVVRFAEPVSAPRLIAYLGASYFLERDATTPQVELTVSAGAAAPARRSFAGAEGWTRFELSGPPQPAPVEVRFRRLTRSRADYCFSLEAR